MEAAIKVLPTSGQDRAVAVRAGRGYLVAVADGAGGTGGGAAAADRVIASLSKLVDAAASADWSAVLLEIDYELSAGLCGGQTTAVVALADGECVRGASVGDSGAWLVPPVGSVTDLTANQRRKPLLGSGEALPVVFEADRRGARLLLATDGLIKYASHDRIHALAVSGSVGEAVEALVSCVRLPSGSLQDDVAAIVVG